MAHKSASLLCVGESAASSRPGVLEAPRRLSPEAPGTADPRPSLRYTEDLELVAQNDDLEVFAVSGTDGEWGQRCDEAVQNSVHGLSGSVNVFPGQHPRSNIRCLFVSTDSFCCVVGASGWPAGVECRVVLGLVVGSGK